MTLAFAVAAVICGLALLVWSADRFVDGAAATALHAGMPTLLIGMVIIGFGTSAPEMVVSAFSAAQGNPGLALGNAYGSNIANIALILGLTALICPINVKSSILRKELPILLLITALAVLQLVDGFISRADAWTLLLVFAILMGWSIWQGMRHRSDSLSADIKPMPLKQALFWTFIGMLLLVVSSRILVWGAVEIARAFGVSDLIIGLTVVAVGTSLPELASALAATRKGEHDLALGNVLGSNLFNTLAVVGIAGTIQPMVVDSVVLWRDCTVMGGLTLALYIFGIGVRRPGRINRLEGAGLLVVYLSYNAYLVSQVIAAV
ncbi:calcium/sodium antiporter [Malonomonas rubra]|uniref:calcium/sodium antiporter n=1 Tax=Malonomonas rubra TaxID=57040 RepID=UPI0026EEE796|nr:calcium/sodium antiporter [Malonomonas rubra]